MKKAYNFLLLGSQLVRDEYFYFFPVLTSILVTLCHGYIYPDSYEMLWKRCYPLYHYGTTITSTIQ